jgi:EAL domain-containing protein (putative c-di-GMP-specific phosphodiesterase class I)
MFEAAAQADLTRELDETCVSAAIESSRQLPEGAQLFLNISPISLVDPLFSPRHLAEQAANAGLEPSRIVIETTADGRIEFAALSQRLTELSAHGFGLALDDVGAGTIGVQILQQFSVDFLKVDRSVVAAALTSASARAVLSAFLAYAAQTGSYVVAEGIETDEMLSFVQGLHLHAVDSHVEGAQGFSVHGR